MVFGQLEIVELEKSFRSLIPGCVFYIELIIS